MVQNDLEYPKMQKSLNCKLKSFQERAITNLD